MQETKTSHFSKKLKGYKLFPKERNDKDGGGLLTVMADNLSPAEVMTEDENVEILLVDIEVGKFRIRTFNAYGPQETDNKQYVTNFWVEFESEVIRASKSGLSILIQMDANAKLGSGLIPNDPHRMSSNGKLLFDIMNRNNLVCLNSDPRCEGTITRFRRTVNGTENAVLDYLIVSSQLSSLLGEMIVDEKRCFTLTKFATKTGSKVKKESDHNPIFARFNIKLANNSKQDRREIFDFKDQEAQKVFKELSDNSEQLNNCFKSDKSPPEEAGRFFKVLNNLFHRSFKKIRIRTNVKPDNNCEEGRLLALRTKLLALKVRNRGNSDEIKKKIDFIEKEISTNIATKYASKIQSHLSMIDSMDGSFNQLGMWHLKKQIFPRPAEPPTAKFDEHKNVITGKRALKNLYLETYQKRLKHREIESKFSDIKCWKEELWSHRYVKLKGTPTSLWTAEDILCATKSLKPNQSRDPNGMISDIFKPEVAGKDLTSALVRFMNFILKTFHVPEELLHADITSIWKHKGSKMDMKNDRGIFILSVLRKILDKALYKHFYPSLEAGMSDSNIGARKHKNVRNHLFMVYGIISSVIYEERECVDIMIYDLVQAFDGLWLSDCMNDLYDNLPVDKRDRKLALVYETNKQNLVAVNTPVGRSERVDMPEIVQQGGGWGPIECSVSIDKIGRDITKSGKPPFYYKNKVGVIPLAMVDDLLAIAPCGIESVKLNAVMNTKIELKKLKFHTLDEKGNSKCHKIHIGKSSRMCPKLKIHGTDMIEAKSDVYLGDIITSDGSNKMNIENRINKGSGKIAEIMGLLQRLSLGNHHFHVALLLRESIFLSSLLFNSEVWYGLKRSEIEMMEALDRSLLQKICGLPRTVPTAALYLETGSLRINTIIKARRINYVHYLAKLDRKEMLSKFFYCQWLDNKKHDWCFQVKQDLREFDLPSCLEQIERKSHYSWKKLVKIKAREYEFKSLIELKEKRYGAKLGMLSYSEFKKQTYLSEYSKDQAQTILRYRTRMSYFSDNFKGKADIRPCPLCGSHDDRQSLSFQCLEVQKNIEIKYPYESVFSETIPEQIVNTLLKIEQLRGKVKC